MGTPKWMMKTMEIPIKMDDLGENPLFSETFFFFRCSIGLSRNWDDGHQLLWYRWVRCLIGAVWDQVQKISEKKKHGWKKSRVEKREITKHICLYIYIVYIYSMFIYVWWYNDIWYDIEFVFGVSNLLIIKKGVPISTQHSYDHHLWWPGG